MLIPSFSQGNLYIPDSVYEKTALDWAETENGNSADAQSSNGGNESNNRGNSNSGRANPFDNSSASPFDDAGLSLPANPLALPPSGL